MIEKIVDNTSKTISEMRKKGMFVTPNILWMFVELPLKESIALRKYISSIYKFD